MEQSLCRVGGGDCQSVCVFGHVLHGHCGCLYTITHLGGYASPGLDTAARAVLRSQTVTHIVEVIDGYLLATVLLIFSLGLYELFISKIEAAENSESASGVLLITSLDDLKARLAKVILMIDSVATS